MFFMHRIRRTNGVVDKGIEVKETAQLSAWAYKHDPNTDFVSVAITDDGKNFNVLESENWVMPVESSEPSAE